MGNQDINVGDLNYATGSKVIMELLADEIVSAQRARANPIKKFLDVSDTVAVKGGTARVIVTATPASYLLTDGGSRVLDDTSATTVDVTLSNERVISWAQTDVASVLSGNALQASLMAGRYAGILNDIESDFVQNIALDAPAGNTVGTYGSAFTEATAVSAAMAIIGNEPPEGELLHGFLAPKAWGQLVQLTNFNAGSVRGYLQGEAAPAFQPDYGETDRPWHGVMWHLCQSVAAPVVSTVTQVSNLVAHRQAAAIAMRPIVAASHGEGGYIAVPFADAAAGVAGSIIYGRNLITFAEEISIVTVYGYASTKPTWSALIKS